VPHLVCITLFFPFIMSRPSLHLCLQLCAFGKHFVLVPCQNSCLICRSCVRAKLLPPQSKSSVTSSRRKQAHSVHEGPSRRATRTTSLVTVAGFSIAGKRKCDDKMSKIQLRAGIYISQNNTEVYTKYEGGWDGWGWMNGAKTHAAKGNGNLYIGHST